MRQLPFPEHRSQKFCFPELHEWRCIWVTYNGTMTFPFHLILLKCYFRGVELALEIPSRTVKRDCGMILGLFALISQSLTDILPFTTEQLTQFDDAGRVYEDGQYLDRAVASFLKSKNLLVNFLFLKYCSTTCGFSVAYCRI